MEDAAEPTAETVDETPVTVDATAGTVGKLPRLCYLGPAGTFTHEAALQVTGAGEYAPLPTAVEVIEAVEQGSYELGVIASESSVDGPVTANLDHLVFSTTKVRIVSEHLVAVGFDALVHPDSGRGARLGRVVSHPVALAQCARWIRSIGASTVSATSTAEACRMAAAEPGLIALAGRRARAEHGLSVLGESVEDHPGAVTRFWCLGRAGEGPARRGPGRWRSVLVCTPRDERTGVLAEMLGVLALREVNLHGLTVRPLKHRLGRYCFVLECAGSVGEVGLQSAVEELLEAGVHVKLLGSFTSASELPGGVLREIPGGGRRGDEESLAALRAEMAAAPRSAPSSGLGAVTTTSGTALGTTGGAPPVVRAREWSGLVGPYGLTPGMGWPPGVPWPGT